MSIGAAYAPPPTAMEPEMYLATSPSITVFSFPVTNVFRAFCDPGDRVTGGGYEIILTVLVNDIIYLASHPFVNATVEGWEVIALTASNDYGIIVTAVCLVLHSKA